MNQRDPERESVARTWFEDDNLLGGSRLDGVVYLDGKAEDPEPGGVAVNPWTKGSRRFDPTWAEIAGRLPPAPRTFRGKGQAAQGLRGVLRLEDLWA